MKRLRLRTQKDEEEMTLIKMHRENEERRRDKVTEREKINDENNALEARDA